MLADAGDEAVQLIRVFDADEVDSAQANRAAATFVGNIVELFVNEKVLTVSGHTKFILEWLSETHVTSLHRVSIAD